jgi:hypothetical protein
VTSRTTGVANQAPLRELGACVGRCMGRRFMSHGGVAQLVEQGTFNP